MCLLLHTLLLAPYPECFEKGRKTMAMRFIRWILPLLVVLTIAIVFAAMFVTNTHAAGLTPDVLWRW